MYEEYAEVQSIEVEEGDFSVCTNTYVVKCVYSVRKGEGCQGSVVYKYCTWEEEEEERLTEVEASSSV